MIRGHFLRTVSYLPHVNKEPVTKGHLSCRDTFSWILRCPLKTGFTVCLFALIMTDYDICQIYFVVFFSDHQYKIIKSRQLVA